MNSTNTHMTPFQPIIIPPSDPDDENEDVTLGDFVLVTALMLAAGVVLFVITGTLLHWLAPLPWEGHPTLVQVIQNEWYWLLGNRIW